MSTPELFTRSLDDSLNASVTQTLLGWPESSTVEFKQEIPGKDGKPDPWAAGGKCGEYGRDKIFKELVAFANTTGGHLILGVEETKTKPPVAAAIAPIPRCHDLAERLSRAAQQIDPPIPNLRVAAVETANDGSGIVIFRVPASRAAPHRGYDLQAYIRRGTESVPMSMREIQDLTLAGGSRSDLLIESRFAEARRRLGEYVVRMKSTAQVVPAFRVTAVPTAPLSLPRLFGVKEISLHNEYSYFNVGGSPYRAYGGSTSQRRVILRGVEHYSATEGRGVSVRLYQDGAVEEDWCPGPVQSINISVVMAEVLRVMLAVNVLRTLGGMPDIEYLVEVEFLTEPGNSSIRIDGWNGSFAENSSVLSRLPLTLPRVSYGEMAELNSALTQIHTDIHDEAGFNAAVATAVEYAPENAPG
jgi:hypothetical protein